MGANNPLLPTNVRSDEEAIQYLLLMVNALKTQSYSALTGSPTMTALQMVGGTVEVSGGTTATATTDTAANIITQLLAYDPNAGVGSTAPFALVNDNSGALTVAGGTGVTIVGTNGTSIAAGIVRKYQIKQLTANTVSLTVVG